MAIVSVLLLSALAVWSYRCAVPRSLLVSVDGTHYLRAAQSVAAGRGLVASTPDRFPHWIDEPVSHFPPGLALSIAALSKFTGDCENAAWWLNLFSKVATAVLACGIGLVASRGNALAGILCGLPVIVMPSFVRMMVVLGSEPLFYPLTLLGWLGLILFVRDQRPRSLVIAGIGFGLATMTRYAGLVWCITLPILAFALSRGSSRDRWRSALWSSAIALSPFAAWIVRNRLVGSSATNRSISLHWISADHLRDACFTFATWALPYRFHKPSAGLIVALVGLAVLCAWLVLAFRHLLRNSRDSSPDLVVSSAGIAAALITSYAVFLAATISFVHFNTPLDERLLSPVLLIFPVAAIPLAFRSTLWHRAALAVGTSFLLWQGMSAAKFTRRHGASEHGFRNPEHRRTRWFGELNAAPAETLILSNDEPFVSSVLGRRVWPLPMRLDSASMQPNPKFEEQLNDIRRVMDATGGFLLHIGNSEIPQQYSAAGTEGVALARLAEMQPSDLERYFRLRIIDRQPNATLYAILPAGAQP